MDVYMCIGSYTSGLPDILIWYARKQRLHWAEHRTSNSSFNESCTMLS